MSDLTVDTPQTDALPSSPSDALWTSDSQRQETQTETVEPAVEEPATPEPVAATPETEIPAAAERDEAGKFKGKGKKRDDPVVRMRDAVAKEALAKDEARQAREETAALKARLEALERPRQTEPTPFVVPTEKFPDATAWMAAHPGEEYEDYLDARQEWRLDRREQQQAERRETQSFNDRLQAAKASDPTVIAALNANPPISPVMDKAIIGSDKAIDIIRYLGTHPEDCAQLARESARTSLDAVPVMRRYLEAQVTTGAVARPDSASVVRPSTANPPINRVGGTASATPVDPEDLDFGPDYIRLENAREKKRQESSRW